MSDDSFSIDEFLNPDSRFAMDLPISVCKGELEGMLELRILPKFDPRSIADQAGGMVALRRGELGGLLEARLKPCLPPADSDADSDETSDLALSGFDS